MIFPRIIDNGIAKQREEKRHNAKRLIVKALTILTATHCSLEERCVQRNVSKL